ncbi:MAG: TAXI family TRAP transporter solute-binding subunit [Alphaproteobacteria bacterium]|nr:TAXI family TRAP transporter solute-binding subunit [Alphaproteobacteria bacterium]
MSVVSARSHGSVLQGLRRAATSVIFAMLVGSAALPAHAQMKGLTIGSGSVGADFFAFGAALQRALAKNHPRLTFENTATSGSIENVRLLHRKEVDVAIYQLSESTIGAWDGTGRFKDQPPHKELRTLGTLFTFNYSLIVPKSSNMRTIEDFKGKRVAIGPDPATQDTHTKPIFQAHGVDYDSLRRVYGSYSDIYRQFAEGRVEAGIGYMSGFIPLPSILELFASTEVRWINLDPEKLKAAGINPVTVPPGTLPFQEGPVIAAQRGLNLLGGTTALTDDQAYEIARILHRELAMIADLVPVLKSNLANPPSLAQQTPPFPYHAGAEKYWREQGLMK